MKRLLFMVAALGVWSFNAFATDYDCGKVPGTVTCSLSADGKTLTVNGTGEMKNYQNSDSRPWLSTVESVVVSPTVTSIGERAFKGASKLTNVVMPGVKTLENSAFNGTKLVSVDMPSVTTIGQSAFENVTTLQSFSAPNATTVGDKAFFTDANKTPSLTSVDLPKATQIGGQAFQNAKALTSVNIPLATELKYDAFASATNLESVYAPNVETLGNRVFKSCSSLESIDLPSLTTIGENAFNDTTSLTEINMPNVQYIRQNAFYNSGLTSVDMPNLIEIDKGAFSHSSNLYYAGMPENAIISGDGHFANTLITSACTTTNGYNSCGTCNRYIMSGKGCVASCGKNYLPENGYCVLSQCDDDKVFYKGACLDEYPFAKKRYTPAEANQWLNDDENIITITYKK